MALYLYASDDPETFLQGGILLSGQVGGTAPFRLYYDHVNAAKSDKQVVVQVRNTTNHDIALRYTGDVASHYDSVKAGHLATAGFLGARAVGKTSSVIVKAGAQHLINQSPLGIDECVCGIFDLLLVPNDVMSLIVFACDTSSDATSASERLAILGDDKSKRKGLYEVSELSSPRQVDYIIGTSGSQFSYGDQHVPNLMANYSRPLDGEYGVVRTFECTLHNSTDTDSTVALYQAPGGGYATATYLIDGSPIGIARTDAHTVSKIKRYTVAAGKAIGTQIKTMTDLNSNAPMNLYFGPDDPAVPDFTPFT